MKMPLNAKIIQCFLALSILIWCGLADAEVVSRKDQTGHFHIMGAINDFPVYFLVDTGASLIVVSPAVARQAGLMGGPCRPMVSETANGTVKGCSYRGRITLGEYNFEAEVVVLPNASTALLGMNALSGFEIHQAGQYITLSLGAPVPSSIVITPANRAYNAK